MLKRQRDRVRRREFEPLGLLELVQLEPSGIANTEFWKRMKSKRGSISSVTDHRMTAGLDWYKTGPLVGLSGQELLVCAPMPPPPRIPDPGWGGPKPIYDARGIVVRQRVPSIAQDLRNFCSGEFHAEGHRWLVFQPVHQILLIDHRRRGFLHVNTKADGHGRHTCLLYNQRLQEGHFLFGHLEVETYFD